MPIQAKLDDARFDLTQSFVCAPSDRLATQLALRPGMMDQPLATGPVMSFVHQEERTFIGWFRQTACSG